MCRCFLRDPVHRAIGLSHSGWRGTVSDIAAATVRTMQGEYGSRPEELLVGIGPSICQDWAYEVSEDVIEATPGHPMKRSSGCACTGKREMGNIS
ncbi:MAG: laccase domain-containing protein [Lachnospiraceae bacterium]